MQSNVYPHNGVNPRQPEVDVLVFWRASASTPRRIALRTVFTGTPLSKMDIFGYPTPDSEHPGFDAPAPQPDWMAPAQAPQALASYWQYWKDPGSAPPGTPFLPGYVTTTEGRLYGSTLQDQVQPGGGRVHETWNADPGRDGLFEFSVREGWNLSCSAIRGVATITPPTAGGVLSQSRGLPWGNSIPLGPYSAITHQMIRETCIFIEPSRSEGAGAIGAEGDHLLETGRPYFGPATRGSTSSATWMRHRLGSRHHMPLLTWPPCPRS